MLGNGKCKLCGVLIVMGLVQLACSASSQAVPATPTVEASLTPPVIAQNTSAPVASPTSAPPAASSATLPNNTVTPTALPSASATATRIPSATPTRQPTATPTKAASPTPPFSALTQLDQWALLMAPANYSPATTSLIFRVKTCATCNVTDPKKISDADDGKGVKSVEFVIIKTSVNPPKEVYRRTEGSKFYCAFGGGEPTCTALVFAENPKGWPGKNEPFDGDYKLDVYVQTTQGKTTPFVDRYDFSIKVKK